MAGEVTVEEVMAVVAVTDEGYQGDRRESFDGSFKVIGGRRGALVLPSGSGEITNQSTAPSSETSCIIGCFSKVPGTWNKSSARTKGSETTQ